MKIFAKILEIETFIPDTLISNETLSKELKLDIDYINKVTGIKYRYASDINDISSDIAVKAAEKLFSRNQKLRKEIDYLIFCTQTFDYASPTSACIIQHKLNLNKNIGSIDIGLGCSGFTYCLSLAKALIENGQVKKILLLTSETLTKYLHPLDKSTRLLFGDGACATVIGIENNQEYIGKFCFGTDGSKADIMHFKDGGFRNKTQNNSSYIAQKDEGVYFNMDGIKVFEFSINEIPNLINQILNKNNQATDFSDINWVILHQASKIVLDTLQKKANIPISKFLISLDQYGNTVSSTIPMTIKYYLDNKTIKNGDKILIIGFGVGLSWCGTVIKV